MNKSGAPPTDPERFRASGLWLWRADSALDLVEVRALFEAYAASLPIDLGYQGFDAELEGLPGAYGAPTGALLVAGNAQRGLVGCVALRASGAQGACEMKRLYVSPAARGLGLGRALVRTAEREALRLGYAEMRLDTRATMSEARALYAECGFREIAAYHAPTPPGTTFMAKQLGRAQISPHRGRMVRLS